MAAVKKNQQFKKFENTMIRSEIFLFSEDRFCEKSNLTKLFKKVYIAKSIKAIFRLRAFQCELNLDEQKFYYHFPRQ